MLAFFSQFILFFENTYALLCCHLKVEFDDPFAGVTLRFFVNYSIIHVNNELGVKNLIIPTVFQCFFRYETKNLTFFNEFSKTVFIKASFINDVTEKSTFLSPFLLSPYNWNLMTDFVGFRHRKTPVKPYCHKTLEHYLDWNEFYFKKTLQMSGRKRGVVENSEFLRTFINLRP